jgi:hypothetical protein
MSHILVFRGDAEELILAADDDHFARAMCDMMCDML